MVRLCGRNTSATTEVVDEVTVANNTLFLTISNSSGADTGAWHMNAYGTATGNMLWSVPLAGQGDMTGQGESLTTYDGYVYIETIIPQGTGRSVYVLNERDGSVFYQKNFALGTGNSW